MLPAIPKPIGLCPGGGPDGRDGRALKWTAILCFALAPLACVWTTMLALSEPPPEHVEKAELFQQRRAVDTIVVGDSRVSGIAEEPFAANGWNYFNMGLSGVSPEDMAMQLKYAMLHGKIRRVAMGVSFEGMTARYPFEFSRFQGTGPFAAAEIVGFATVDEGPRAVPSGGIRKFLRNDLLPIPPASLRLRWRIAQALGRDLSTDSPAGVAAHTAILEQIAAGNYDFARQRDPKIYFSREDSEPRFLENPVLAPYSLRLYRKAFASLRAAKIACVVFETGRTAEYQQMIEAHAELVQLQRQWREYFRSQSYGGVTFLDAAATRDCYAADDFFDAVHFIGLTGTRLAARLADELAQIEKVGAVASPEPDRSKTAP